MEEHVIIRLLHQKNQMIPVKLQWVMDWEDVRKQLQKGVLQQEPIFFFYYCDATVSPVFNKQEYSQSFKPEVPACYKGYVGKKIYGNLNELLTK